MPKLPPKPPSVTGIQRTPTGTRLTLSDGSKVETRLLTTIGWCPKLKEAPIIMVGEKQYRNEAPLAERKAWAKADRAYSKKVEVSSDRDS